MTSTAERRPGYRSLARHGWDGPAAIAPANKIPALSRIATPRPCGDSANAASHPSLL
jgi:hypothetical protein